MTANIVDDMIWKTTNLRDAWKSFAHTLTSSVSQALTNMFSAWIQGIIKRSMIDRATATGDAAAKAPSALLDSISSFGAAAAVGGAAFLAAMALSGGFREDGGPVTAGKAYIVGERRPELFIPSTSGVILPRVDMGQSMASAQGSQAGSPPEVHVVVVNDEAAAARYVNSIAGRNAIVKHVRTNRTEVGIQS